MSVGALVVAETRDGAVTTLTLELLATARAVASELGGGVAALLMASCPGAADALIAHGADRVYEGGSPDDYDAEAWLAAAEPLARELEPGVVLAGDTPAGSDLAPRLAFRLDSAVATRCVSVQHDAGRLLFTRACYGGNVRETVSIASQPAVATLKAGIADVDRDLTRTGEVVRIGVPESTRRTRVIARNRVPAGAARLEDAKIIVAGGRGLDGAEGFAVLERLAKVLGATVGSSRVPCDLGWCPHSWQIGLTGKTVTPDLYVAVGISGAGHHMAGCGTAKNIVAINTDPDAAIFRQARFGVVGDYREIVPALASAAAKLKQAGE